VTDVRAARAALDRGRPVVLITPPAVEQADAVWELVSPAIPALVVCLEHTIAAEWAARAPASLRVHAVTSLGRSIPLLKERPVDVLAGTAEDLAAVASKSALKLDTIRTIVLAWPEAFATVASSGALDTLLAETKDAARLVLSWNPAALADLLERHAHRPEIVGDLPVDADGKALAPVGPARYVVAPPGRRAVAARETLDALRAAHPVVWNGGEVPGAGGDVVICTVVPTRAQFAALAKLSRPVLLLTPAQLPYARTLASPLTPVPLADAAERAQGRVAQLRARVTELIERGEVDAELALLAPLFERFDAAEVAAALLALQRDAGSAKPPLQEAAAAPSWVRVFVSVGKKDGVGAKDLVGALIREAGLARDDLGRIELRDTFCLVDVAPHAADQAIQRLTGTAIRGRRVQARRERER